jgi:hypothetical protein
MLPADIQSSIAKQWQRQADVKSAEACPAC